MFKYPLALLSSLYLLAGGQAYGACNLKEIGRAKIVEVVDGDTVILDNGKQVRMVGTQAPKLKLNRKNFKDWPLADKAKAELEKIALNKMAILRKGGQAIDRHDRILAHLFIQDDNGEEIWLQQYMLQNGLARTYSFRDNRSCIPELLAAEHKARISQQNIWQLDYYKLLEATDLSTLKEKSGTYQLVEGVVKKAGGKYGKFYINFGENYKTDFTIIVEQRDRLSFAKSKLKLNQLVGKKIRIRGWLIKNGGPMIKATHPELFEILD